MSSKLLSKRKENIKIQNLNAGLFLFFLVLTSNFTMDRILPNSLIRYLENSRLSQHIIAFLILLFTINLYATENEPFYIILGYVILLWLWFLITTKMHLLPVVSILLLLLISYICYNVSLNLQYKEGLDKKRQDRIKFYLDKIQTTVFYLIIFITLIGGSIYFAEKYKKYKNNSSSLISFIFKFYFLGTGSKSTNV